MMRTTIRTPPPLGDFTPLSVHQEQTPESFYDGKPILYYHTTGAKAWIPKSQLGKLPFFPADLSSDPTEPEGTALNGTVEENVEQKVDLFVTSQYAFPFLTYPPTVAFQLTTTSRLEHSQSSAPPPSPASRSRTPRLVSTRSRPSAPATRPTNPSTSRSNSPTARQEATTSSTPSSSS